MASIQKLVLKDGRLAPAKGGDRANRFRAFYRDAAGRQVARVFTTRRDAQHWLDERTHERVTGTLADRRAGRQTLAALWEEVHERETYAPATIELHRHAWTYLEPLAGRRIGDISRHDVEAVLERIARPAMRQKVRQVLSSVLGHAVEAGRIAVNPARAARRSRTRAARSARADRGRTHLDAASVERIAEAMPERYRALVRLMGYVGLRPGEAYALTVGQVGPVLTVDRSIAGPTKTGEPRDIPLPPKLHRMLEEHKLLWSDPTDPGAAVFTNERGGPVEHGAFRRLLARTCRRAAIEPAVTPNELRHHAAAHAIAAGATVYDVQRMLGHARPSITLDTYGFLLEGSLERLAERLDASMPDGV